MIKADHKKYARWIFIPYMNRILKKNFSHFHLANEFPKIPLNAGLVITPNHISWWDGFFAEFLFSKLLNRKLHIMMLEEQLKKYWFFKKLGAYSIQPDSIRSILETAKYTKELIIDAGKFVITYPQGEIESFEKRPLTLKEGLKYFIRGIEKEFYVLPVGFKIHYYNEKYPSIIARFGNPLNGSSVLSSYSTFENEFMDNLDKLAESAEKKELVKDLFA
jgi:hypothetical protein